MSHCRKLSHHDTEWTKDLKGGRKDEGKKILSDSLLLKNKMDPENKTTWEWKSLWIYVQEDASKYHFYPSLGSMNKNILTPNFLKGIFCFL